MINASSKHLPASIWLTGQLLVGGALIGYFCQAWEWWVMVSKPEAYAYVGFRRVISWSGDLQPGKMLYQMADMGGTKAISRPQHHSCRSNLRYEICRESVTVLGRGETQASCNRSHNWSEMICICGGLVPTYAYSPVLVWHCRHYGHYQYYHFGMTTRQFGWSGAGDLYVIRK